MSRAAWLLPALPLLAAVLGLLLGRRLRASAAIGIVGAAAATALAVPLLLAALEDPGGVVETTALLTPTGAFPVTVGTRVDGLAALVALVVCVVALLVQVYSTGYLVGDPRYPSYAAQLSLFTAAMLTVVLAGDLFVLLLGWEVMGVCSYLLIGHHHSTAVASRAAVKAFLVTRLGDVGFLFGIFTLSAAADSSRIADVLAAVPDMSATTVTVGTLLLLCGVAGKSAQFPLHVWLPDAMAGPTPVSALIHAATMVAAGVYVVARLYPAFVAAPVALAVLAVVASVTMLLGALAALAQDDLKRVLAWSTVSQLAYMTGALAVGGYTAGLFHLVTHAAFKALLFLAAGSVLHTVGTNLMSEMGGLWRRMPVTFVTTCVGLGALVGLPPLSGAISKDAVLAAAEHTAAGSGPPGAAAWTGGLVYAAGLATVVVTAAYAARLLLRTFFGPYRGGADVHESPPVLTVPLVLLAVPGAALGLLTTSGTISTWLPAPGAAGEAASDVDVTVPAVALTTALVVVAAAVVWARWRRAPAADPLVAPRAPVHLDVAYGVLVVRPTRALARLAVATDDRGIDATVEGSGTATRLAGAGLRRLQNGNVQSYATGLLLGVVALAAALAGALG